MELDSYYTPRKWADRLVAASTVPAPKWVADFAAGDGTLLEAAEAKWSSAGMIAGDSDLHAIKRLRVRAKTWRVIAADFLQSRQSMGSALRALRGSVDVVLLNPPFSCRGAQVLKVTALNEELTCSRSLAFIVRAIPFLSDRGEILAVLPRSVLRSQKDARAREFLSRHFVMDINDEIPRGEFRGCAASAVIVGFSRRTAPCNSVLRNEPLALAPVLRGSVQMHTVRPSRARDARQLVHTTNLNNGVLSGKMPRVRRGRDVEGPGVLIPRVGKPAPDKIVVVNARFSATLSDCVLMVPTRRLREAEEVSRKLKLNWERLEALYSSTAAPYLTVGSLSRLLGTILNSNTGVPKATSTALGLRKRLHGLPAETRNRCDD